MVFHSGPCVAVDPTTGFVFVAWEDYREYYDDVYFARSINGGKSFQPSFRADQPDPKFGIWFAHAPSMAVSTDGRVYIAWHQDLELGAAIWLATSIDHGASFGPPVFVDFGWTPSVTTGPTGEVYIAFGTSDERLGVSRSLDGGASFRPPALIAG